MAPVLPFIFFNTSLAILVFFCDLRLCTAIVTVSLLMLLGESNNHKRVNCMRHACEKLFIWCNISPVIDCTLSCPCFGWALLLKIKHFSWWIFFFLSLLIGMPTLLNSLKYAETVSSWPSHNHGSAAGRSGVQCDVQSRKSKTQTPCKKCKMCLLDSFKKTFNVNFLTDAGASTSVFLHYVISLWMKSLHTSCIDRWGMQVEAAQPCACVICIAGHLCVLSPLHNQQI